MSWFVYMLRCADNSIYTGITRNVETRVEEHNSTDKGAKYTRTRRPVKLIYVEQADSRSSASKREYEIKQFSKAEKASLAIGRENLLHSRTT